MYKKLCSILIVIILLGLNQTIYGEILFLKGGGMLKGDIKSKTKKDISIKIKYGLITISRKEIEKITEDTDPDAIYNLAKYHVEREEWDEAIEEFDNLLLIKPDMKNEVLTYVSDLNFAKSSQQRLDRLESITEAYKMVEEGKKLANFADKQLQYKALFKDKEWRDKLNSIAQRNKTRGENLMKKGQSIISSYHKQREEEIRKAREKAKQEKEKKK